MSPLARICIGASEPLPVNGRFDGGPVSFAAAVSYALSEMQDSMVAREEPRAEHHVGLAVLDGSDELWGIGRVVFEIGVLDQDDLAACLGNAVCSAAPFPRLRPCFTRRLTH